MLKHVGRVVRWVKASWSWIRPPQHMPEKEPVLTIAGEDDDPYNGFVQEWHDSGILPS